MTLSRFRKAIAWRMRRALFLLRYEVLRNPPYSFKYYGFDLTYGPGDMLVRTYSILGAYEPHVIAYCKQTLRPKAVVFDIGANIGLFSFAVLGLVPASAVHMFEPSPSPRRCLEQSLARNRLSGRVKLNSVAVYAEAGEVEFHVHQDAQSAHDGIRETHYAHIGQAHNIKVPATSLDVYVQHQKIDRLDLVKIDAEGAEYFILRGAVNTMRQLHPHVIFEVGDTNLEPYGLQASQLHQLFCDYGYRVQTLGGTTLSESDFTRAQEKENEFVAVPG